MKLIVPFRLLPPLTGGARLKRAALPRRVAARRAVVVGLAFALALHLGMGVAMETVRPQWRDPEYGHRLRQLRALRAASPGRPLVVALGSSRTQMGLCPAAMPTGDGPADPLVYSFGQAGAGPLQTALTLARLLGDGVKPDFVLLEYFPLSLAADGKLSDVMGPWLPKLSRADARRLHELAGEPGGLDATWAAARLNPWYSMRLTLMSHWQPGWLPWPVRQDFMWTGMDPRGWLPYPHDTLTADARAKGQERIRKDYANSLAAFHVGALPAKALRDAVVRCRAAGVPVAAYWMPESPAFHGWYAPGVEQAGRAYLSATSREVGLPVFDAAGGFAEEDFADGHHMLKPAAAAFSRRLWEGHVKEWVRGK